MFGRNFGPRSRRSSPSGARTGPWSRRSSSVQCTSTRSSRRVACPAYAERGVRWRSCPSPRSSRGSKSPGSLRPQTRRSGRAGYDGRPGGQACGLCPGQSLARLAATGLQRRATLVCSSRLGPGPAAGMWPRSLSTNLETTFRVPRQASLTTTRRQVKCTIKVIKDGRRHACSLPKLDK